MSEDVNRRTMERVAAAFEQWDLDEYESVLAVEAVEGRPQTGQRFVGRSNIMGMYRDFPEGLRASWRRLIGGGSTWALEGEIDFGKGGSTHVIGTFELDDGLVTKVDFYFATKTEPPVYHAGWAEPGTTEAP